MSKFLTIGSAFEQLTGKRPHPSTVWRWALKGSNGVTLKTWMIGGRRMTTAEAVNEFIEKRSAKPEQQKPDDSVKAQLNKMLGKVTH